MKITNFKILDVKLLEPDVFNDERGCFFESLNTRKLEQSGIIFKPVQENSAFSLKLGTVRGIHFQNNPMAQTKIVRCSRGKVIDYAVDLRKNSKTYLKYVKVELSESNHKQLLIPKGFGHLVVSIEDNSLIEYLVDNHYSPEHDRSINCLDESIGIVFPVQDLILSVKDKNAPLLKDSDCNF